MFATQSHVRETTDPNGSTIFATWCPVRVVSDAQSALRGRRVFPDLSDLRLDVHVETREGPSERVRLDALALGPGMEQTIELRTAVLGRLRRPDALSVTVSTAAESPWESVGTEIGVPLQVRVRRSDRILEQQATLPEGTRDGLRVGIAFTLAEGFEHSAGIGLGSWENYPDRASSALLGRWESTIDALAVPYILQQENGTRGGVDSLLLSGPRGRVEVSPREPPFLNVSHHTVEQLGNADTGRGDPAHRNRPIMSHPAITSSQS